MNEPVKKGRRIVMTSGVVGQPDVVEERWEEEPPPDDEADRPTVPGVHEPPKRKAAKKK